MVKGEGQSLLTRVNSETPDGVPPTYLRDSAVSIAWRDLVAVVADHHPAMLPKVTAQRLEYSSILDEVRRVAVGAPR